MPLGEIFALRNLGVDPAGALMEMHHPDPFPAPHLFTNYSTYVTRCSHLSPAEQLSVN